jgi:hypothetical protein
MPSKVQTHSTDAASSKRRSPKPAPENLNRQAQRQTRPATLIRRAGLDPGSLTPHDVLQLQRTIGNRAVGRLLAQTAQRQPTHKEENVTGLPVGLKAGVENLSGLSLDDVKVHYNSSRPAELHALAYTRGTDIHIGPGQERHLPHEAWHVVQQKQGLVKPSLKMKREPVNTDPGLEKEADVMGARASRGEVGGPTRTVSDPATTPQDVIQPKMGLELEMLVLTDIAGRPAPEKVLLGTYGNLDLVVDRNPELLGKTPVRAALAPLRRLNVPETPPGKGTKRVLLGKYDLPVNYKSRRVRKGQGLDPRPERVNLRVSSELELSRPTVWQDKVLDSWIKEYATWADNWENDLAQAALKKIINLGTKLGTKYPSLHDRIDPTIEEAKVHLTKWQRRTLLLSAWEGAVGMEVSPTEGDEWATTHPVAEGLTGEGYDSIVEIVTKAYDIEDESGAKALLADMADAAELASKIEDKTGDFTRRVPLESVGVAKKTNSVFVGSETLMSGTQQTDASIQTTLAVALQEIYGFFHLGMGGFKEGNYQDARMFGIKHQSITDVAKEVGQAAPRAASNVITDLRPKAKVPSHLLGLLTLISQYLLMGAKFEEPDSPQLDKNAVSLLSRTDLAKIYNLNVPEDEKKWVTPRLDELRESLLRHTGRDADALLLRPEKNTPQVAPTRAITCEQFIDNIFTAPSDGFTPHLDEGIFKQMGPEVIPGPPPSGSETRTAPVFELRNMIPPGGGRFPKEQWVPLTQDLVKLVTTLNAQGFWKGLWGR